MSTICKIDRAVRLARSRRREAIGQLVAMRSQPGDAGVVSGILAGRLDEIRRDPRLTGAEKEKRFKAILNAPTLGTTRPV